MPDDIEKELGLVNEMGGAGMREFNRQLAREWEVEYIRQCLRYDSGKLYWLRRPIEHFKNSHGMNIWNTQNAGKEAGGVRAFKSDKRWRIRINKKHCCRARLVWMICKGVYPSDMIDHINHDTIDDRIENLREATGSQNQANRMISCNNTSGYKGVVWCKAKGKWQTGIKTKGKYKHIGYFLTPEDAHAAYVENAKLLFGEFAHAGV